LGKLDIARAIDIIEAELSADLSYAKLSRLLQMPVATLARAFRTATGQSLHRFVLERRVARACNMLAAGKEPLAGIAFACGFSSQAHMTAVFAKLVGTTPARYRANC
jgi:AraC family transcriptional regulator